MAILAPSTRFKAFSAAGLPLAGGKLYSYQSGTTTPLATYTDQTGVTPNANPVILDANGEASVWLGPYAYKFVLTDSLDVVLQTTDKIYSPNSSLGAADIGADDGASGSVFTTVQGFITKILSSAGSAVIGFIQAGVDAIARPVQDKLRETRSSNDYSGWGSRNYGAGLNVLGGAGFTGVENTAFGSDVLTSTTTGFANVGVGVDVLSANTTGGYNTAIGVKSLYRNISGNDNSAFGTYTLYNNTSGIGNCAYGQDGQRYADTGSHNVTVGVQALYNNGTGSENTAIGTYSARGLNNPGDTDPAEGPSPTFLTALGAYSAFTASGTYTTALGHSAGYSAIGSCNTYVGANSGYKPTSGARNSAIGYNSMANVLQSTSASNCVALGQESYTTGDNAIAIGSSVAAAANTCAIGNSGQTDIYIYGNIQTQADNTYNIGAPAGRFKTVYATTGAINTSDEREKTEIQDIDPRVIAAWARVKFMQFKFRESIEKKGNAARLHFGVIAQRVKDEFEAEGLDPFAYGVLCFDEWANEFGEIRNRYGVRYEEALILECAYLRSRLSAQ